MQRVFGYPRTNPISCVICVIFVISFCILRYFESFHHHACVARPRDQLARSQVRRNQRFESDNAAMTRHENHENNETRDTRHDEWPRDSKDSQIQRAWMEKTPNQRPALRISHQESATTIWAWGLLSVCHGLSGKSLGNGWLFSSRSADHNAPGASRAAGPEALHLGGASFESTPQQFQRVSTTSFNVFQRVSCSKRN